MPPKDSGWTSPEFWATLIGLVFTLLVGAGAISKADATTLQGAILAALPAVITVVGLVVLVVHYVAGRFAHKIAALDAAERARPSDAPP